MENNVSFKQDFCSIVTGGSSGIGAATVKLIAKSIKKVFVLDRKELTYSLENVSFIKCDVSKYEEVKAAFEEISRISKIGYVFCNAGIIEFGNIETTPQEKIIEIININLVGTIYTLKETLPIMKANNFGRIVLMGSDQSFIGKKNMSIYGATKGAIAQLTKSTALEYAKNNITVNCVCPGTIETETYHDSINNIAKKNNIDPQVIHERTTKLTPLQRNGKPEDVANVVQFLFSEQSSFITGSLIPIDGGYTAQ